MIRFANLAQRISTVFKITSRAMAHPQTQIVFPSIKLMSSFATFKVEHEEEENDMKSLLMKEQEQMPTVNYSTIISQYPFHHIVLGIVRNPAKFEIDEELKHNLIAFKALTLRGEDIETAARTILTPQKQEILKNQTENKGQLLFDLYFQDKVQNYANMLNEGTGTLQERLTAIIVLRNMREQFFHKKASQLLDERKIVKQDETKVLTAYYIAFAIKHGQDYIHLLPLIMEQLEGNSAPETKLKIARSIISITRFEQFYPQKIIECALGVYTSQLSNLHNYQILYSLRFVYNYTSQGSRKYGEALLTHIKQKHITEGNIDFHIPMILKSIKYCNRQRLSCEQLIEFISKNMNSFKIIFEKKNISKGLFFSLLFSKSKQREVSPEVLTYLKEYFFETVKQIANADQAEEGQLLRVSKLLIKYYDRMSTAEKQFLRKQYLEYIIPHFNQESEVLLYSLLVVLREKKEKPVDKQQAARFERQMALVSKMIVQYLNNCSKTVNDKLVVSRNINSAIELMYQIIRHDLKIPKSQLPSLLDYDFAQKQSLSPQVTGYFFFYLTKSNEKISDITRVLTQIQPLLETFIRKKRIYSLPIFYSILDVCDKAGFEHQFLFKHLENFFGEFLMRNPNHFVQDKDIKFINEKMLKRGYGSINLKKFINGVLENPKNWPKCKQQFLEREKAFQARRQEKRRSR